MSKTRLGDKKTEEYVVPSINNIVRCFRSETLFIFGLDSKNTKYRWCLGVGRVCKIMQGENFDLLYINFGRKYAREIIVQYNHARRQLLTLKVGQLATFYGKFKIAPDDNPKNPTKIKTIMYAIGLQAWYVPRAMEIKKIDLETYDKVQQEDESNMMDLIDELIQGKKL